MLAEMNNQPLLEKKPIASLSSSSSDSNVFDRGEIDSPGTRIGSNVYNLLIGLTLCWGFLVNWIMLKSIPVQTIVSINPWVFFIGYFASCFLGVFLFTKFDTPFVSFLGYNLVVVPFGFVINLVVARYDNALVLSAMRVTGIVTFVMMILSSSFPAFFQRISGALTISLLIVILVELSEIFIFHIHHGIID